MTQQHTRPSAFDDLASDDERYRIGYSGELFTVLENFGFHRGATILDAGCGTGLATGPLVAGGMTVTGVDTSEAMLDSARRCVPEAAFVTGNVERLTFADASFDGAVSAQSFHLFDNDRAYSELMRVVKPGGPVAVWWKLLGSEDPMRAVRSGAAAAAGIEPNLDPLRGGFSAFYRAPFAKRTLRVIPFMARLRVSDWLGYERSRAATRALPGDKRKAYLDALSAALLAKRGSDDTWLDVRYTQFLYLGQSAR